MFFILFALQEKLLETQRVGFFKSKSLRMKVFKRMKNKKIKAKWEFLQPAWIVGRRVRQNLLESMLISWNMNLGWKQIVKKKFVNGLRSNTNYSTFGHGLCWLVINFSVFFSFTNRFRLCLLPVSMSEDTEGSVYSYKLWFCEPLKVSLIVGNKVVCQCLHLSKNDMCSNIGYKTIDLLSLILSLADCNANNMLSAQYSTDWIL